MTRFLCLLLLLPTVAIAQNQKLSERALFESEPFIAMDPANPKYFCAAWMSGRLDPNHPVTIVARTSSDAGATWSEPVDLPHFAPNWQSADVSIQWARNRFYVAYIDYVKDSKDSGGVYVSEYIAGNREWLPTLQALDAKQTNYIALDRPWIAVDSSGNDLYIPTKPASWHPLPNHAFITRSNSGGQTWSDITVLDSVPYSATAVNAPMGSPAVSHDGTLYIAYPFFSVTGSIHGGLALARSVDLGASFTRSLLLEAPSFTHDSLAKSGFRLLAHPTDANRLAIVWVDGRNGDYDVFCSKTTNAGVTWSSPLRINDDPIANGVLQDMAWPTYASDGTLVIVWRDRRNGAGTGYQSASDTYYAFSRDGGNTFSKNYRLSDSTAEYKPILDNPGNDFMSVVATPDSLYGVWADTRTGIVQVYFAKAALGSTSWVGEQLLSSNHIALSCYPNPATNSCTVTYSLDKPSPCSIVFVNEEGTVLRSMEVNESVGKHAHSFNLAGLASSNYWIEARTEFGVSHTRLIIK